MVWLVNVEDPFRLAGAVLVLATQVPIQRQVLAWGFAPRARRRGRLRL